MGGVGGNFCTRKKETSLHTLEITLLLEGILLYTLEKSLHMLGMILTQVVMKKITQRELLVCEISC
jgi:hypothetical protein